MEIKLTGLDIDNFKGIPYFSFYPSNKHAVVYGDNGTGKTTLKDAFLWLLFGKDSNGRADFALKPLNSDGSEKHNLDTSVRAELFIDTEEFPHLELKKVFKEKWTKKRGQASKEFTGHTTDHFINGVPVQKKEWDNRIGGLIEEEKFRLVTDTTYFNSENIGSCLSPKPKKPAWKIRRDLIFSLDNTIPSDDEIMRSNEELSTLVDSIGERSLDDHRAIVDNQKKEINKQLTEIPARIDEQNKSIAVVEGYSRTAISLNLKKLESQLQEIKDDSGLATLRKRKAEAQADLREAEEQYKKVLSDALSDTDKSIGRIESEIKIIEGLIEETEGVVGTKEQEINALSKKVESLRKEFVEIDRKVYTGDTVCPACGQELPADQIDAAVDRFNRQKSERLADINKEGKETVASIKNLEKIKSDAEEKLKNLNTQLPDLHEALSGAKSSRNSIAETVGQDEKRKVGDMLCIVHDITAKIETYEIPDTTELEANIESERVKIAEIDAAEKSKTRVAELSKQEKDLAAEYERLERDTYLMDRFTVRKVEMLEDKINSKFELARFRMFEEQINGGIKEVCITTCNGVPYGSGLNTGAEINASLDIIKTLSDHYDIKAPIFIDHAEAVTELLEMDCQTIKLIVSERHKEMEVKTHD